MDVVGLEKVSFGEKPSFTLIVVYSYLCSALTHARKKNDRASGLHEIVVINGARIAMTVKGIESQRPKNNSRIFETTRGFFVFIIIGGLPVVWLKSSIVFLKALDFLHRKIQFFSLKVNVVKKNISCPRGKSTIPVMHLRNVVWMNILEKYDLSIVEYLCTNPN